MFFMTFWFFYLALLDGEGGMSLKVLSLKTLNDSLKVMFKDGAAKSDEFSKYFKVVMKATEFLS